MALLSDTVKSLMIALTNADKGNEVASALNNSIVEVAQVGWTIKSLIVATSTSTTTDFAALAVGDKVVVIPASAGNSHFVSVATAATLPEAAVIGSLYVVLRAYTAPSATSQVF